MKAYLDRHSWLPAVACTLLIQTLIFAFWLGSLSSDVSKMKRDVQMIIEMHITKAGNQ